MRCWYVTREVPGNVLYYKKVSLCVLLRDERMEFFFFALLFFSLPVSSVCLFFFKNIILFLQKKTVASLSHQKSLSLSFSLLCFFSREHVLCASKQRERETFISVFFVFFFFCCSVLEKEIVIRLTPEEASFSTSTSSFSNARIYIQK